MNATSPSAPDQTRRLVELVEGYWTTQVIGTAVRLGLPDLLAEAPQDAASLARAAHAHAPALERLMRALVTLGLCTEDADGRYALTPLGRPLAAAAEGSMRGRVLFAAGMLWRQFGDLTEIVTRGGRGANAPADFASLDPRELAVFQQAMLESSLKAAADAAAVYDFGRFRRILDVGGGFGGVLGHLLGRYPGLTGDVLDLANVAAGAEAFLARSGLSARAGFIAGSFFESVPAGYDCYHLKFILHDWDDDKALRILERCRAAAGPEARLVVLEQVVPERLEDCFEHRAVIRGDLTMLTVEGKERTAAEYRALMARAGFALADIRPTASSFSVLEATPI